MTKKVRPYSRVYWEAIDDPKFADVWDDDARLGCWLRLLVVADMAHPASATLPAGIRRSALSHLVSVGLVDMQGSARFRIHGLDRERAARADHASNAAASRWDVRPHPVSTPRASGEHPVSSPQGMPRQDETRRDEQRQDESRARAWDAVRLVEDLTGRSWTYGAGNPTLETLRADVQDYGRERVESEMRAYRAAHPGPMDAAVLVTGMHRALMPLPSSNGRSSTPKPKGYQPDPEEVRRAFGG